MFSKEEKYMHNESKVNTIATMIYISIISIIFMGLLFRFDRPATQVSAVGLMVVMTYFLFTMSKAQKRQRDLQEEIEEAD